MKKTLSKIYHFVATIPDRVYPFSVEIEGERVRWQAAYDEALSTFQKEYGYGRYGVRLIAYRGIFHVIGSSLFILFATLVTQELFDTNTALYTLLIMAIIALGYQELVVQKRTLGQHFLHSVFDWFSWVIPMAIYVYVHSHGITLSHLFY